MDRLRVRPGFRWREGLLFAAVAVVTAASVAFAGIHLRQLDQAASASDAIGESGSGHLPDVLEGACLSPSEGRS